jgi:hypothetical protein
VVPSDPAKPVQIVGRPGLLPVDCNSLPSMAMTWSTSVKVRTLGTDLVQYP